MGWPGLYYLLDNIDQLGSLCRSRVHSGPPAPPILNEEDDEVYFGSDSNIDSTEKSQRPAEQVCPGPPRSRSRVLSGPPAPPILNEEEDEVCFGSDSNIDTTEKSQRPAPPRSTRSQ